MPRSIPMHGGDWWYCCDTGCYENHWVKQPLEHLDDFAKGYDWS